MPTASYSLSPFQRIALSVALLSFTACDRVEPLILESLSPQNGPAYGGTALTITGQGFDEQTRVTVGGADCTEFKFISAEKIRCKTPAHPVASVDVQVFGSEDQVETFPAGFSYTCLSPVPEGIQVWANDGGDKVTRDEMRATCDALFLRNRLWDGQEIGLFAAKNEVVSFNLVLESSRRASQGMNVSLPKLVGPGGFEIRTRATSGDGVFDYTGRNIELFYVRYLKIEGLSRLSYETYDERHVPRRMRRGWEGQGFGNGGWHDRPDADKYYPEIAVPLELEPDFEIAADENQSIWTDIYVPHDAPAGTYTGTVTISGRDFANITVPVRLEVRSFALPDVPNSKTMVYLGYRDLAQRYLGVDRVDEDYVRGPILDQIRDRHFQVAHRHKISLIDDNSGHTYWTQDRPRPSWDDRLSGALFTAARGYDGPGAGVGNNVYSIGNYGNWDWENDGEEVMHAKTDAWENWFIANSPNTERFLYLIDESKDYPRTEAWAHSMRTNTGVGKNLPSFATIDLPSALEFVPSLNIIASWFAVADRETWQGASDTVSARDDLKLYLYNGKRPASGSFATEDDGVALRELPWGQYKKNVSRWFFWESTYYNDFQTSLTQNNVFSNAKTFGFDDHFDASVGRTGFNHSNGDGVLFYPGTDEIHTEESYGVQGPIASLRMKNWRRGIQDIDYVTLARAIDPARTDAIVNRMVPKVLWENDVDDIEDPTHRRIDISWSTDPDAWEEARAELADIIEGR